MKKLIALALIVMANIALAGPGDGTGGIGGGAPESLLTLRPPPCCDV